MSFILNPYWYTITNKSLLFDGVNESVFCGTDSSIDFEYTDAFSLSAWVRPESFTANRIILGKDSAGSGGLSRGYFLGFNTSGAVTFQIRRSGARRMKGDSTNTFSTSTWYHVVLTYDGSNALSGCTLYIDNSSETLTNTDDDCNGSIQNSSQLCIGGYTSIGTDSPFDGYIDQVTIWNKELTGAEVSELYNSGSPLDATSHSASANLVSYYPIDSRDSATGTIYDREGSNNGTPQNMEEGDLTDTVV
jgi:hypothetical protein